MSQLLSKPVDYKKLKKGDKIHVHLLGKQDKFSRSGNVKKHLSKNAEYKHYVPLLEKRENDDFKTSFSTGVMTVTVKDIFRVKSKSNNPSIPMMIIGSTNYGEYAFVSDRDAFYKFRTKEEIEKEEFQALEEAVKDRIPPIPPELIRKMREFAMRRKGGSKTIKRGRKTRRQKTRRQKTRRQKTRRR